ncbi:unnamed protein product [Prunus armeniaca]|uniref:Uncharacterized protein n=1 Tax=Prunus armeniaca TaxID=36596 RepID=A0A6J5UQB5_PRUAR|nr:unnamed protein product [Prunus armeniaca]CAB4309233.1 unnamed protein product [Prunus armeniaca]
MQREVIWPRKESQDNDTPPIPKIRGCAVVGPKCGSLGNSCGGLGGLVVLCSRGSCARGRRGGPRWSEKLLNGSDNAGRIWASIVVVC